MLLIIISTKHYRISEYIYAYMRIRVYEVLIIHTTGVSSAGGVRRIVRRWDGLVKPNLYARPVAPSRRAMITESYDQGELLPTRTPSCKSVV